MEIKYVMGTVLTTSLFFLIDIVHHFPLGKPSGKIWKWIHLQEAVGIDIQIILRAKNWLSL